jgi:hypothetical protein
VADFDEVVPRRGRLGALAAWIVGLAALTALAIPATADALQVSGNVVGATVHWSDAGPHSFASVKARALRWLGDQGSVASAASDQTDPLVIGDPLAGVARHRQHGPVPWYRRSPASFFVNPTLRGARFEGIVLSELPNGTFYRCSGTVVNSPNGSVVWTAGHCLFNREFGQPFTAFMFIPYAQQGPNEVQPAAPYGVWPAVQWEVTKDWYKQGNARHIKRDLGVLLLARNAAGQTLKQVLGGAQRLSFDASGGGRAELFGYPGAGAFAGNDRLVACGPRPLGRARFLGNGPPAVAIACNMTVGASGGPWLQHVRHGVGTIIAVTSAIADTHPWIYGPLIDRADKRLFTSVSRRAVPAM